MAKKNPNIGKNTFQRFDLPASEPKKKTGAKALKPKTTKYSTRLNTEQLDRLKYISEQTSIPITRLITEALYDLLKKYPDSKVNELRRAAVKLGKSVGTRRDTSGHDTT